MNILTVRTRIGQVHIACPGCNRRISVPKEPNQSSTEWTERPYWCTGCGGTAPQVVRLGIPLWGDPDRDSW